MTKLHIAGQTSCCCWKIVMDHECGQALLGVWVQQFLPSVEFWPFVRAFTVSFCCQMYINEKLTDLGSPES